MPANFLVRAGVKTRIQELIGAASPVPVFRAFPPNCPDELVWIASTTGGLEHRVMGSNLPREDLFSVIVVCMCFKPGDSPEEAEERVEEIASTVIVQLAENVRLDDEVSDEFSIIDAVISSVDGPDAMPGPDGEGWDAFVRLSIDIHLRITREQ